jgi:hypothetical protein
MLDEKKDETKILYPCPVCKGARFNFFCRERGDIPEKLPCWACKGLGVVYDRDREEESTQEKVLI